MSEIGFLQVKLLFLVLAFVLPVRDCHMLFFFPVHAVPMQAAGLSQKVWLSSE